MSYGSCTSRRPSHSDFDSDVDTAVENNGSVPSSQTCTDHPHTHSTNVQEIQNVCQKDLSFTAKSKNGKCRHKRQNSDMQSNHQCSNHNNANVQPITPYHSPHIQAMNYNTVSNSHSSAAAASASGSTSTVADHVYISTSCSCSCAVLSSCNNAHNTANASSSSTSSDTTVAMASPAKIPKSTDASSSFHRSQSVKHQPFPDDDHARRSSTVNSAPS